MLILLVMACSSSSLSPSQSEESDPYSVHLLHVAMKTRSEGLFIAKVQTHMARMGDKVSIALLKDLSESELLDPNKVEEYLPIIQESFSQPQFIEVEIDKRAKVTMFLLKHVRQVSLTIVCSKMSTTRFDSSRRKRPKRTHEVLRRYP